LWQAWEASPLSAQLSFIAVAGIHCAYAGKSKIRRRLRMTEDLDGCVRVASKFGFVFPQDSYFLAV
jgi:hypothetical protein